jgi:hypothetical protein
MLTVLRDMIVETYRFDMMVVLCEGRFDMRQKCHALPIQERRACLQESTVSLLRLGSL